MGQPEELFDGESQNKTVGLIQRQSQDNRPYNRTLSIPSEGGTRYMQDIEIVWNRKWWLDCPQVWLVD